MKPIPGAKYVLYCDGHIVKSGVESNEKGTVSLDSLAPGAYEMRQTSAPKGYQPASSAKFTVTGLSISGGDREIRTSEGKKITAGEKEVLVAGAFSPDIELTAENEKQIEGIVVTYENFGASLGKAGAEKSFDCVTLRAAQEEINHLKNEGEICGAVHITYSLKEPACNLTQYLMEEPAPTQAPASSPAAAPNSGTSGGAASGSNATAPTNASPTPTPVPTQAPAPSVVPIATPAPTVEANEEPEEGKPDKRNLTLTVLDTDGKPVPGVTVGLFEPAEDIPTPASTADPADISQSISNLQNQQEAKRASQDPYKRSAALQIARTDEHGQAAFQKVPLSELVAVPVKVPDGYSTEKISTEILAGLYFRILRQRLAKNLPVSSSWKRRANSSA